MDFGIVRAVKGDLILSPAMPRAAIRYSPVFIYLGDLQYIARETHHVEEFIFLTPNSIGHAVRLLLVHFEGFLENKEGSYEYLPQQTVTLAGEEYQYEPYVVNIQDDFARFSGSDLNHAADYIRQRSYTLAGDMVYQRFMRFVSNDRRNLFSISYLERVDDLALTTDTLKANPETAADFLARARECFSILKETDLP